MDNGVCVVTVTYGNRWQFLKQVIERALSFKEVARVIVIDNASVYPVVTSAQVYGSKVMVLTNKHNEGSAGGYHKGIRHAFESTADNFIWLLDDDNVPAVDCLLNLLQQWDNIKASPNKKALFCLRDDRQQHVKIARGEDAGRFYLVPDNFLGFNVFNILKNQLNKAKDRRTGMQPLMERAVMPYVPYGGLLLHRDMVAEIGYPDQRFYLYVDDSEYTYRITQHGGKIWLIPACKVIDVDKSQGINYKKRLFRLQLLDEWSFRTYYHIRNRMYFYARVAIKNNIVFGLNKILYLSFLWLISLLSGKTSAYKKLKVAVNDGLNGNLGQANPDKF